MSPIHLFLTLFFATALLAPAACGVTLVVAAADASGADRAAADIRCDGVDDQRDKPDTISRNPMRTASGLAGPDTKGND